MSWEEVLIGDNCQVLSAKRIFAKDYVASGIPFYRSKEIIYKAFNQFENDEVFIKEERFNEIKNKFGAPKRGDVLISSVGNRSGISYWVKEEYDFYFKDGNLIWFRNFNDKMSSKYLVYFLNSELGQAKINNMFIGAAQKALTIEGVKRIKLSLPPSKTQKRIADILSAYDDLIENNLKRIKLLEQAAQNIYKEWFVNMRFPGHENTLIDQETGLPEGWKEKELSNLVSFLGGFAFKSKTYVNNGKFRVITIRNVGDKIFNTSVGNFVDEIPPKLKKHCFISEGDILLSLTGNVGRSCIAFGENNLLNQRVAKIKAVNNNWSPYIYWMFNDRKLFSLMNNLATGSAQQNLSPIKLAKQNIIIPDELIIDLYSEKVNSFFNQIILLNKSIIKLKSARDILLPRLMNQTIEV